jgi:hypothetical protein
MESTEDIMINGMSEIFGTKKEEEVKSKLEPINDFSSQEEAENYIEERVLEGCKEEFTIRKIYNAEG